MKISVQSVHFTADAKLLAQIEERLNKLNRYFDHPATTEVILRLQDTNNKVRDKIVEVKIHTLGQDLVDKKTGKSFEKALNASAETLKRQLTRLKHKKVAHTRIKATEHLTLKDAD